MRYYHLCICSRSLLWRRVSKLKICNDEPNRFITWISDRHDLDEIRGMRYIVQYNTTFTGYRGTLVDPFPVVALPFLRALDRAVCKFSDFLRYSPICKLTIHQSLAFWTRWIRSCIASVPAPDFGDNRCDRYCGSILFLRSFDVQFCDSNWTNCYGERV